MHIDKTWNEVVKNVTSLDENVKNLNKVTEDNCKVVDV